MRAFARTLSMLGVAAAVLAMPSPTSADPVTFDVQGVTDSTLSASVTFDYDALLGVLSVDISNTSDVFDPRITGFAFNSPSNVSGISAFSGPSGWSYSFDSNDINTPGQFGLFDVAGLTGNNLNGGFPNAGIARNSTASFDFTLAGSSLNTLTTLSFLSLLSFDAPGSPNEAEQYFLARFQRVGAGGGGSDVGIPADSPAPPPSPVPEPATMALCAFGLAGAVLGRRRARQSR